MKSPLKYPKWPIYLSILCGAIVTMIALYETWHLDGTLAPISIGAAVAVMLIFTLMGWSVASILATIFTRKVNCSLTVDWLEVGETYYLNGKTPATYLKKVFSGRTHRYIFHIAGYNNPHHLDKGLALSKEQVETYLSAAPETN